MTDKEGWEFFAVKHFCPRDAWGEGIGAIPGTWDEDEGSWYDLKHRCSNCHKESGNILTPYCPYCGKRMEFVQKMIKEKN